MPESCKFGFFEPVPCPLIPTCQAGKNEGVSGNEIKMYVFCRHYVCEAGMDAARKVVSKYQENPIAKVKGTLIDGSSISGIPFGAGEKPYHLSGCLTDPEKGRIFTPTHKKPDEYYLYPLSTHDLRRK